jgi:hypothetical protein
VFSSEEHRRDARGDHIHDGGQQRGLEGVESLPIAGRGSSPPLRLPDVRWCGRVMSPGGGDDVADALDGLAADGGAGARLPED